MTEDRNSIGAVINAELRRVEEVLRAEMKAGFSNNASADDAILQQVRRINGSVADLVSRVTHLETWRGQHEVEAKGREDAVERHVSEFRQALIRGGAEQQRIKAQVETLEMQDKLDHKGEEVRSGIFRSQWAALAAGLGAGAIILESVQRVVALLAP